MPISYLILKIFKSHNFYLFILFAKCICIRKYIVNHILHILPIYMIIKNIIKIKIKIPFQNNFHCEFIMKNDQNFRLCIFYVTEIIIIFYDIII